MNISNMNIEYMYTHEKIYEYIQYIHISNMNIESDMTGMTCDEIIAPSGICKMPEKYESYPSFVYERFFQVLI